MHGFMTTGTVPFLQTLIEKHPEKEFQFMKSNTKGLLYYEDTKKKSIFISGGNGELLLNEGAFATKGFVVMYHIPVPDGETAIFEHKVKNRLHRLADHPSVNTVKLLNEKKSIYYIIIMQWKQERDFDHWQKVTKDTDSDFFTMAKLPASFTDRPFTNAYYMITESN